MIRAALALLAAAGLIAAARPPVRPAAPDWTRTVTATPTGSYVLGNPAAKVRLIEYVSYTCPHCAHYIKESALPLRQNYVRTGKVSVELRHAVRDGLDLTAALLTRCGNQASFFRRSEAVFANQDAMFQKIDAWQAANPAPTDMDAAVKVFAKASGLSDLMVKQGIPLARQNQCLNSPEMRATLEAQAKEAWSDRKIPGTPAFLLGDNMFGGDWKVVDGNLRAKVK